MVIIFPACHAVHIHCGCDPEGASHLPPPPITNWQQMQQWQRVKIRTRKREKILKATENKGQEGGKRGERSRAEGSGITMYSIYSILSSSIAEDNRKICATTKLHSTEKQSWHEKLSLSVKHTHMHACTRPHAHVHTHTNILHKTTHTEREMTEVPMARAREW